MRSQFVTRLCSSSEINRSKHHFRPSTPAQQILFRSIITIMAPTPPPPPPNNNFNLVLMALHFQQQIAYQFFLLVTMINCYLDDEQVEFENRIVATASLAMAHEVYRPNEENR